MSKLLQAIRDEFDRAVAEAEAFGAAPEGLFTILAERERYAFECILREDAAAAQRVVDEAAPPRAA